MCSLCCPASNRSVKEFSVFLQHSMLPRSELTLQSSKCGSQSVPPNLVLNASLGQIRTHKMRLFAKPAVSLFQQNPTCLGPRMKVSNKQICTLVRQSYSKADSVLPSNTGLYCSFCHCVLIVSVLVLCINDDEWLEFQSQIQHTSII